MVNYVLDFNGSTYEFRYDESDRSKYTIFACAKNENDYVAEWVDYHLSIGFDKIFICDNNDVGDDSLYKVLESYVNEGTVEIFDVRGFEAFQCQVYDMYSSVGNYEWCAFIDIDEFIEIGSHYFDIKDYLSNVRENCVLLNWMVYGYDGNIYKSGGKILDTYKTPVRHIGMFKENAWVKSIVRGGMPIHFTVNMHTAVFEDYGNNFLVGGSYVTDHNNRQSYPPIYKHAYIRHYYSRSMEDYFKKTRRGDAFLGKVGSEGLMTNDYNIAILGNTSVMPIEKHVLGLYMYDNLSENGYKDILDEYDVIVVVFDGESPYNFIHFVNRMMMSTKDHTFVLSGVIDNSVFNQVLDYSFETGNKVVWCEHNSDLFYKTFIKYRHDENKMAYYIFNI